MIRPSSLYYGLLLAASSLLSSCGNSNPANPEGGSSGTYGIPWNSKITYGSVKDNRDNQTYRTVEIGTQTWMAQNLNYAGTSASPVGVWYNNNSDSGAKYGRLYTWADMMVGHASSAASPSGVQGVCPAGWHVPSDTEWSILTTSIGGESSAGEKLKSASGWMQYGTSSSNGTDAYGFRVLPAAARDETGAYLACGYSTFFWSATLFSSADALARAFSFMPTQVIRTRQDERYAVSVRCLKD